ncbi:MAG: zf-HC2 domain-containing protein [Deltaproteobacteria bacterium]|nr:zf-HC2 domain-containing protein [Deltaproteobacteria bacterium]
MECKDIQKLLSPFVDNELSAHESFNVAEHLEECIPCHREMEELRQCDEQLKAAGRAPLTGVEELRAAITWRLSPLFFVRRWRSVGATAAALLFLVIGKQLFSAPADPEAAAFSEALVAEMQLNINQPFSLAWLDPQSVQDILKQEGLAEIPNLAPAGFHLEGARICYPLSYAFLQLVYRNRSEEVTLFVSRRWTRSLSSLTRKDGFTIVPLGIRAVFLVAREALPNFVDTRDLAEEEISALST